MLPRDSQQLRLMLLLENAQPRVCIQHQQPAGDAAGSLRAGCVASS